MFMLGGYLGRKRSQFWSFFSPPLIYAHASSYPPAPPSVIVPTLSRLSKPTLSFPFPCHGDKRKLEDPIQISRLQLTVGDPLRPATMSHPLMILFSPFCTAVSIQMRYAFTLFCDSAKESETIRNIDLRCSARPPPLALKRLFTHCVVLHVNMNFDNADG